MRKATLLDVKEWASPSYGFFEILIVAAMSTNCCVDLGMFLLLFMGFSVISEGAKR